MEQPACKIMTKRCQCELLNSAENTALVLHAALHALPSN